MKPQSKRVVMLVDDKNRDLMVATLLAWHFKRRGVECFLEPLEAWRGAVAAHRPHLMIFNHMVSSHLVEHSLRLAQMGVLTAVMVNEGLCYDDEERNFNAGKHHSGAHIDFYFCWNEPFKQAMQKYGFGERTHIEVVGPARYDYYRKPWSRVFDDYRWPASGRPKLLVCSNFGIAKFFDAPKSEAKRLFAPWTDRIPIYRDWWSLVEINHRAQRRFLGFLDAIVRARRFDLVLRPHPREDLDFYRQWLAGLPKDLRKEVQIDATSNITSLILACDLQVGCENCNTTLESWIAGKPTVELIFERHPVYYSPAVAALSPNCERPEDIVAAIERELADPRQARFQAGRAAHLDKWCAGARGDATARITDLVASRLARQPEPDWSRLDLADRRRGLKLKALRKLGKAYHYKPLVAMRGRVLGGRHKLRAYVYDKAVTPATAKRAMRLLESKLG